MQRCKEIQFVINVQLNRNTLIHFISFHSIKLIGIVFEFQFEEKEVSGQK